MKTQAKLLLPILLFAVINIIDASKEAVGCGDLKCGVNAICKIVGEKSTCVCKDHHEGNPCDECLPTDCRTNTHCGLNANCTIENGTLVCDCIANFTGDPYVQCKSIAEENKENHGPCTDNNDCRDYETCYQGKCQSPCFRCGKQARCHVISHHAQCYCPFEYVGDPYKECFYFYHLPPAGNIKDVPRISRTS